MPEYFGAGYTIMSSDESGGYTSTIKFAEVHGGFLHKLSENVFLDIQASYYKGVGDIESGGGTSSHSYKNENTQIVISAGIKAFFNLK